MRVFRTIQTKLATNWFLLGLIFAIFAAKFDPSIGRKDGPLNPDLTVKVLAVSFIFFSSGLTLRSDELKRSIMQFKVHIFVQGFSMGFVPIVGAQAIHMLGYTTIDPAILKGLLVVCCLPPPVSSAAILTKASGGNEAAAIFNSAFGSFLGIFVTPFWLLTIVGVDSEVPAMKIAISLGSTVVLPLVIGQLLRLIAWRRISSWGIPFGGIASTVLLVIIYSAFCESFSADLQMEVGDILTIVGLTSTMIMGSTLLCFFTSQWMGYSPKDVICIMYCSTHKSLTLGMPLMKIVFNDNPMLPIFVLPLLAYHPSQIFWGGLLAPSMKGWRERQERLPKWDDRDLLPRSSISAQLQMQRSRSTPSPPQLPEA